MPVLIDTNKRGATLRKGGIYKCYGGKIVLSVSLEEASYIAVMRKIEPFNEMGRILGALNY